MRANRVETPSRERVDVSRTDRRLFSGILRRHGDAASERLPCVEAGQTPISGDGDLLFGKWTRILAALFPESAARRDAGKAELRGAGYYQPHAWENLASIRYLGMVIPVLVGLAALIALPSGLEGAIIAAFVSMSLLGWALPGLYVKSRAANRLAQIEHAIPDMLDMLNMCVSQGLTVPESLSRIAVNLRAAHPALAQELRIFSEQATVGTLDKALENLGERVDVPEMHSFTSLILQTQRMGTSVSVALSDYSDNMRESFRQQADAKANSAAFKLLFPTAICLMPAVYLFLLGPAIIELSDFFHGGRNEVQDIRARAVEQLNQPRSGQFSTFSRP